MYSNNYSKAFLVLFKLANQSRITALVLLLMILALPGQAFAQSSQLQSLGNDCGGALANYGNCTAGEISISSVTNVTYTGNPANCVVGQPLTIATATVSYEINTTGRNDLLMWIGEQQGTDPRTDQSALPGSCSTFSLPGPFAAPPTAGNPFGNLEGGDADQCGDFENITGTGSRDFANIPVTCQDNDNNGFADLNILLTWSQNTSQACGFGTGQTFPTVGAPSKCDYDIVSNNTLPVVQPPRLTLVKQVTNNSGGTAVAANFTLTATGPQVITGATGSAAVTNQVMQAGAYTLSETGPANYTGTWNCTGGGTFTAPNTITLANGNPGQVVTCTVTNDDNPATLTLVKNLVNDNGGTSTLANWTLTATGASATVTGLANSASIVNQAVPAGNYTLAESGPAGYTASAWSCPGGTLNGNVLTLALGQNITCTITNDDQAANLTLTKTVINNNGGTAVPGAWTLTANATGFTSGVQQQVNAGTYTLAESGGPAGYTAGSWQCTGGSFTPPDQLTLALGQTASCAIVNDDQGPSLTLLKNVTNDNGGNDAAGSFALTVAGGTFGGGQNFASGATPTVAANTAYTLSETPNAGYTLTNIQCVDNSNQQTIVEGQSPVLNLALGQSATCTYFNNDDAPRLTLIKFVDNGDGGSLTPGDFDLTLQGIDGTHDTAQTYGTTDTPTVLANVVYTMSEVEESGYVNEGVVCVDDNTANPVSHPVSLAEGQQVTCTLTNNDVVVGSLTVVKSVDNGDGGLAVPGDFDLHVTGDAPACGQDGSATYKSGNAISPAPVDGCTYTVTEDALAGYSQVGDVTCTVNGSPAAHPVPFATGDVVICTIANTDDGAMLALTKVVTNDNGGTAVITDWNLNANGPTPQNGDGGFASVKVSAGQYTLTESAGPAGYSAGSWDCGAANDQLSGNVLTLANGDNVTCTITNDDVQPLLTLNKAVINNDGGTAVPGDWTLTAGATGFTTGVQQGINAGTYTLAESGPSGYAPTGPWQCTGDGSFTAPDQITLAPGDVADCGIINDDNPPTLTLVKNVINDDGALGIPESFTLTLQGTDGVHDTAQPYSSGASPVVQANVVYTVDEQLLDGYTNEGVACVDTSDGDAPVSHPVTLAAGQAVTCTLTNDDVAPTLALTKVVINDDGGEAVPGDFTLVLTGADGGTHDSGADYTDGATPAIKSNVLYTLSEQELDGYELESIECVDSDTEQPLGDQFTPARGQNIACTVTNDDVVSNISYFRVTKDFTDNNPGEVDVFIDCNTGLILDQDKTITEASGVIFVVKDYTPGNLTCKIYESPVPAGYSEEYDAGVDDTNGNPGVGDIYAEADGCSFEFVEGGDFYCAIINNVDPVDVIVEKLWIGEFEANGLSRYASADYTCYNVRTFPNGPSTSVSGGLSFDGDSEDEIGGIYPHWNGNSYCEVTEVNVENPVEPDDSECSHVIVTLGNSGSCTIYNTLFLEGIPTLNHKGLALLALLMLGMGIVGFRRFS